MRYEGRIYRPGPNERGSYLLQVTIGCSHNECTFCDFYKDTRFRVRPFEELEEDIMMAREAYKHVPGVFLTDGNVACLSMDKLRPIMQKIKEVFPESKHTNMFATYKDIHRKTLDELKEMKSLGLETLVIGLESGSDIVLQDVKKDLTSAEVKDAADKLRESGIILGTGAILGLGGKTNSDEHIRGTIETLNTIQPQQIGLTILNLQLLSPLTADVISGDFELPTYGQIFKEELEILKGLELSGPTPILSGVLMPNHHILSGTYPQEKERMISEAEQRFVLYKDILDAPIQMGGSM